jgi:hypothetical protein
MEDASWDWRPDLLYHLKAGAAFQAKSEITFILIVLPVAERPDS